jgi:hypothetical protein
MTALEVSRPVRSRALYRSAHVDVFDATKAGSVGTNDSPAGCQRQVGIDASGGVAASAEAVLLV